jgi:hypothetical protein
MEIKKQRTIALSSMEAEIMALVDALKDTIWLKELLKEVGLLNIAINIYEDNQACIKVATNPIANDRTKHIMAKTKFVKKTLEDLNATIHFVETKEQRADGYTKGLGPQGFREFMRNAKLIDNGGVLESSQSSGTTDRKACSKSDTSKEATDMESQLLAYVVHRIREKVDKLL